MLHCVTHLPYDKSAATRLGRGASYSARIVRAVYCGACHVPNVTPRNVP